MRQGATHRARPSVGLKVRAAATAMNADPKVRKGHARPTFIVLNTCKSCHILDPQVSLLAGLNRRFAGVLVLASLLFAHAPAAVAKEVIIELAPKYRQVSLLSLDSLCGLQTTNVLGSPLQPCCTQPMTGFYRSCPKP